MDNLELQRIILYFAILVCVNFLFIWIMIYGIAIRVGIIAKRKGSGLDEAVYIEERDRAIKFIESRLTHGQLDHWSWWVIKQNL